MAKNRIQDRIANYEEICRNLDPNSETPETRVVRKKRLIIKKKGTGEIVSIKDMPLNDNNTLVVVQNQTVQNQTVQNQTVQNQTVQNQTVQSNELTQKEIEQKNISFGNDLMKHIDEIINDRNHSSTELGSIGENLVVEVLEEMNKQFGLNIEVQRISIDEKHAGDIIVWDRTNKILFSVEVKNKTVISREDIKKFDFDLKRLIALHRDYKVVGLFISLFNKLINETIQSFTTDFDKTYITRDYFTVEFLRIYIESIRKQLKIQKDISISDDDKKMIEALQENFAEFKFISDECAEMEKHIQALQEKVDNIKNRFKSKISSCQEVLVKYDPESQKQSNTQRKLVEYCRRHNWKKESIKVKDVRDLMKMTDLFATHGQITKDKIITMAKQYEEQYGY